jgi:hypothetical protein
MSEMVENAAVLARSVDIPLIADADTGYGNELNVTRTVREFESRNVAAIHIEDQVFSKRCGHLDGKEIVERNEFSPRSAPPWPRGGIRTSRSSRGPMRAPWSASRPSPARTSHSRPAPIWHSWKRRKPAKKSPPSRAKSAALPAQSGPHRTHAAAAIRRSGTRISHGHPSRSSAQGHHRSLRRRAAGRAARGANARARMDATVAALFRRLGADEWSALRQHFQQSPQEEAWVERFLTRSGMRMSSRTSVTAGRYCTLTGICCTISGRACPGELLAQAAAAQPGTVLCNARSRRPSAPGRTETTYPLGAMLWAGLKQGSAAAFVCSISASRVRHRSRHGARTGHRAPGTTLVCGDSHTCTNGGLGALAFGIGSSEIVHVLATQTLRQQKPRRMRVRVDGRLPRA